MGNSRSDRVQGAARVAGDGVAVSSPCVKWTRRRFIAWVSVCATLSALLRLRFVFTPLTADEGGYLAIGRAWGNGKVLYRDVWVDRPQGLLVLYRAWDRISLGSPQSIRVMAIVFGVVAVYGAAVIARCMTTPLAGVLAALLVAVMSSAPAIEGFTANGELLSGALSVVCLAIGSMVITGRLSFRWMLVAGVAAGLAMSIKQSGYDGLLALVGWIVLAAVSRWRDRHVLRRLFVALIGGLGMVWIVLAAHGAISGWSRWLYAVGGYRFEGRSAVEGADWSRLWMTLRDARLVLYPAVLAAAIYAMYDLGRWRLAGLEAHHAILPLWLVTGFAAFVTGGQFFHHYWVTITFPIGVTTAVLIGSIPSAAWRNLTIVLVLVMPLASTSRLTFLQRDRVPVEVAGYNRAVKEERVGEWFASNGRRGETLYVHCASAAAYAYADEDPIYPFLWFDNVRTARNAQDRLRSMFATPALRPTYVALFQSPSTCDPSGVVERTLEERYERLTTVDGVTIMHQVDPSATTAPHPPDLIG